MAEQPNVDRLPILPWEEVVGRLRPSIFRVFSAGSSGTGFVVALRALRPNGRFEAVVATARHVVAAAIDGAEDVFLHSADGSRSFDTLNDQIFVETFDPAPYDVALLLVRSERPILEWSHLRPIPPADVGLDSGAEIAWMGYAGIGQDQLCFFHGFVSAWTDEPPLYLVDGVAIHGVSGGPVVDRKGQLIGLVSAYIPNRRDMFTTLPGLAAVVPINAVRLFMEESLGATVLDPVGPVPDAQ